MIVQIEGGKRQSPQRLARPFIAKAADKTKQETRNH